MSRLGKKPIVIPQGVIVELSKGEIKIKGEKDEVKQKIHPLVAITQKDNSLSISVKHPEIKEERALWGTFFSLLQNMIEGVTKGYEKRLVIEGVGFTWEVQNDKLIIKVGLSHPLEYKIPSGIIAKVEKGVLIIRGADKQLVGQVAAQIRAIKKPEPYKGKGIRYIDEVIRRKAGKQAATAAKPV